MSISPSTNQSPDPSLRRCSLAHPLLWVVLAMTILVAISLFRGTQRTVKRDERNAAGSPRTASPAVREKDILQSLNNKTVHLNLEAIPREAAIADVGRQMGIPIWFDRQTFVDEGVNMTSPVTIHVQGITGRSALRLILSPVHLTWLVEAEVLKITTATKAAEILSTRVYDVSDLVVVRDAKEGGRFDLSSLQYVIKTCGSDHSWDEFSGPGSIMPLRSAVAQTLAIRQTQAMHEEIARLLADLRKARRTPGDTADRPVLVNADQSPAALREAAIRQALDKPISIDAKQRPLPEVVSDMARQIDVQLFLDRTTLADEGVAIDGPVTLNRSGISARSALKLVLQPLQLTWIIRDEVLYITTSTNAGEYVKTHVYDMTDIAPKFRSASGTVSYDLTSISNAISTTIQPDSDWGNGPGVIMPYRNGGIVALVIPQSQSVHEDVADFLEELRTVLLKRAAALPDQPAENANPIATTIPPSTGELREAAILQALEKIVDVDYQHRPLEDVLVGLGRQLNIPVWIDRQTLTDEGVALDQPVTIRLPGITGRSVLRLILSPVQLD